MSVRNGRGGLAALVVAALTACGSGTRANSSAAAPAAPPAPAPSAPSYFTLTPPQASVPQYLQSAPADRAPLMSLLDRTAAGRWMEQNRINVFGYVEGSYTYNTIRPVHHLNFLRLFDAVSDDLQLNQFDIAIERKVDPRGRQFDWGFHLEGMFGTDGQQIHSNGLDPHGNPLTIPFQEQFDLPQAYVDLFFPIGDRGLTVRAGKFEALFGGTYNPNNSLFYSRSIAFGSIHPLTFTGVLGSYDVNDRLKLELGFSRGWDQSLKDNNGAIDGIGRMSYRFNDRVSASLAAVIGPEQRDDNSHYRTLIEGVVRWAATDRLSLILDAEYGHQGGATLGGGELRASDVAARNGGTLPAAYAPFQHGKYLIIPLSTASAGRSDNCDFYGVSGYASYKLNDLFTVNFRAEWFRDEQGYWTVTPGNYYELTLGTAITPFAHMKGGWGSMLGSNFVIRPEIRWDKGAYVFDGGTHSQQFTVALDAIIKF